MPGLFDNNELHGWRYLLLPLLMAIIVGFSFQGSRSLFGTSEARYAECGREMAESGNWLEPTLGYKAHWSKPPLTYWGIAAGLRLLGNNEWGARLFNAFAFVFTVLAVSGIGRLLYNRRTGSLAGLIYATSLLPVLGGFTITTDMLLTMWVAFAVYFYLRACHETRKQTTGYSWIFWFWTALGMGFFTKGPPALLILMPIIFFQFTIRPRRRLLHPGGIAFFLLLSLWWFITVCTLHPELWDYYLGTEIVDRIASSSVHNHAFHKAFKIYIPPLTVGLGLWFPMSAYLFSRLKLYRLPTIREHWQNASARFLLLWLALPLVVFMVSSSKLTLYVLPIFAPLCIATAAGIYSLSPLSDKMRRAVIISLTGAFAMVFAAKMLAPLKKTHRDLRSVYKLYSHLNQPETRFTAVNHKGWDLFFYSEGNALNLTDTGSQKWADGTIQSTIDAIKSNQPEKIPQPQRNIVFHIKPHPLHRIIFFHPIWKNNRADPHLNQLRQISSASFSNEFWAVFSVELNASDK